MRVWAFLLVDSSPWEQAPFAWVLSLTFPRYFCGNHWLCPLWEWQQVLACAGAAAGYRLSFGSEVEVLFSAVVGQALSFGVVALQGVWSSVVPLCEVQHGQVHDLYLSLAAELAFCRVGVQSHPFVFAFQLHWPGQGISVCFFPKILCCSSVWLRGSGCISHGLLPFFHIPGNSRDEFCFCPAIHP